MADERTFDAEDVRPNEWVTWAAASPFMLIAPLLVAAAIVHPAFAVGTFHLTVLGLVLSFFARRRKPWAKRAPVKVRVERDALVVTDDASGQVERIDRKAIQRGVNVPSERETRVRINRKGGPDKELVLRDGDAARGLLAGLGLGADQTVASFRGMSRTYANGLRLFATIFGTMLAVGVAGGLSATLSPSLGGLVSMTGMLAMLALTLAPSTIEVGADGVLVRWLWSKRFISHEDILDVERTVQGFGRSRRNVIVLELRSGEKLNLPTGAPSWDGGNAEMIEARINDARRVHEQGDAAPMALLQRGEREHRAWVRALRTRDLTDLRSAAVPKDELWRVIEDKGADAIDRGAAVIALGPELSPDERGRLKKAAKVIAAPKLRVVLDDAPDAAEDDLAEMLADLEKEAPARTRGKAG
jgi:hypothetical protein